MKYHLGAKTLLMQKPPVDCCRLVVKIFGTYYVDLFHEKRNECIKNE